jgi:hypothetical protein
LVIHPGMTIRSVLMELPVIVACISGVKCLINECKTSMSLFHRSTSVLHWSSNQHLIVIPVGSP